jgi:hypothetical protein
VYQINIILSFNKRILPLHTGRLRITVQACNHVNQYNYYDVFILNSILVSYPGLLTLLKETSIRYNIHTYHALSPKG